VLEHSTVVVAPPSAATRLARLNADQLFDIQEVVRVLAGLDPSPIGVASLAYSDSAPREVELEDSFAATDEQVAAFQASVPDEDWEESGLADMPSRFLGVTERNQVAAMAGIETWGRDIAQIGVCSAPQYRGRGFGRLAAAAAVSAAVRQGSVAQWRCRLGNEPSRRLGQALGFVTLGHQAAVTVESSARA
jgi:RimJ/RimL family protein N-acetyltransferase